MKLKTLALACGVAMLTACASGGGRSGDRSPDIRALLSADAMMFVSFDSDGDLSTTSAEIEAGIGREFARADTNGDGSVQAIEFQNWSNAVLGGGQLGPYRLDFDRNVDNVISRAEFENEIRARVRDYDENGDTALQRTEYVWLIGQARRPETPRPTIN